MIDYIITMLQMVCYGWFATTVSVQPTLKMLRDDWTDVVRIPGQVLSCIKCSTFWMALLFTRDINIAIASALIASIADAHIINNYKL